MIYHCRAERRRAAVAAHPTLNGIDFIEVVDSDAAIPADRQLVLRLRLIKPLGDVELTPDNVEISGGERIRDVTAVLVSTDPASADVEIRVNRWGDFSEYTLRLVEPADDGFRPLSGFDEPQTSVRFGFKAECPGEFDCATGCSCTATGSVGIPDLDYLTKDYQGFRRLMLDRITTLSPPTVERHAADLGVTLVEALAYVADYLSHQQDAIATEAYLATARRRVSVRRHARLVDYRVDEGAAARVLVSVRVSKESDKVVLPATPDLAAGAPVVRFLTGSAGHPDPTPSIDPGDPEFAAAVAGGAVVFELAEPAVRTLRYAHNTMALHTWGGRDCCLPAGATSATLVGDLTTLAEGDLVVLAETKRIANGRLADADPGHRHPVRLTAVALRADPLAGLFDGGAPDAPPLPVTDISWDPADALPFPLTVSAQLGDSEIDEMTTAYGNIVLADHGLTPSKAEQLPPVPQPTLRRVLASGTGGCAPESDDDRDRRFVPPRYRPRLDNGPLSWQPRVPLPARSGGSTRDDFGPYDPAAPCAALLSGPSVAVPALVLVEVDSNRKWLARSDLLASDPTETDLVVEPDDDGRAALRFGDDVYGRRPAPDTTFLAHYRVGNGAVGNVAGGAIRQAVTTELGIESATNPLPGWGGRDPETLDQVRQRAPVAFRTQERAVTADDYAQVAQRFPEVSRAVATIGWTGSWRTIFVTVDRVNGLPINARFVDRLRTFLERYRLAGHDVEIQGPVFVPLELELSVCVQPGHFRADVRAALLDAFTDGIRADGQRGVFHPDELTFGETIYLSRIYAAAQAVPGVASVQITTFRRLGAGDSSGVDSGQLTFGRTEIARLNNDPNFPDRGVLRITLVGGQ